MSMVAISSSIGLGDRGLAATQFSMQPLLVTALPTTAAGASSSIYTLGREQA